MPHYPIGTLVRVVENFWPYKDEVYRVNCAYWERGIPFHTIVSLDGMNEWKNFEKHELQEVQTDITMVLVGLDMDVGVIL